jgi:acetoin utilization protein AcuC
MDAPVSRRLGVHVGRGAAAYGFTRGTLPGGGHLLTAQRFDAYWAELERRGLASAVVPLDAEPAPEAELLRFHTAAYLRELTARCAQGTGALDTSGATPAEPQLPAAGAAVVGAVLDAARRVGAGELARAYVPIAGFHHAWPDHARAYCVLNDAGVLIRALRAQGYARVAYVDIDVHLGDGVVGPLVDEPGLLMVDVHQLAGTFWYSSFARDEAPEPPPSAWHVLRALPPRADDAQFFALWAEASARLEAFAPDFVVLNAGVDSLAGDRLGGLLLTPVVHHHVVRALAALADRTAEGRLVVLGGGGYGTDRAARGWCEVTAALLATLAP